MPIIPPMHAAGAGSTLKKSWLVLTQFTPAAPYQDVRRLVHRVVVVNGCVSLIFRVSCAQNCSPRKVTEGTAQLLWKGNEGILNVSVHLCL